MTIMNRTGSLILFLVFVALLTGCTATGGANTTSDSEAEADSAAADYCTENGGVVETRYPLYGANNDNPLQLSGSLQVCTFTADDDTRITVGLDTLYTDQPTMAALAYRAQVPLEEGGPAVNPSTRYCTQLGGTAQFGGPDDLSGGGWVLEGGADILGLCVFPDLSVIDAWGITYHSDDTIRGADLTDLFRFRE